MVVDSGAGSRDAMRVLLVAYEYPPSPSPQSLRWLYLSRELVAQGIEVHVLSVEGGWCSPTIQPPKGVVVHRTPGNGTADWIRRLKAWRDTRRVEPSVSTASGRPRADMQARPGSKPGAEAVKTVSPPAGTPSTTIKSELNWKGHLAERLGKMEAWAKFPDERGSWRSSAQRRLTKLLDSLKPDLVISSHEPATTLQLGLQAKRAGFPWVADLGDPVLSFYTPERWRRKSLQVERETCREVDHLILTTDAAKRLLMERHGISEHAVSVLTQGYDAALPVAGACGIEFDAARLELLYTGSFYQFRQPKALIEAVIASPDVRLSIATVRAPEWLPPLLQTYPDKLRLLGFLPHAEARALQRAADVLINIANDDPVHVPGKLFEYLGAGRPILHLGDQQGDAAAELLLQLRRGVIVSNRSDAIADSLQALLEVKRQDQWCNRFDLDEGEGVACFQWQQIGLRLVEIIKRVQGARVSMA